MYPIYTAGYRKDYLIIKTSNKIKISNSTDCSIIKTNLHFSFIQAYVCVKTMKYKQVHNKYSLETTTQTYYKKTVILISIIDNIHIVVLCN